VTFDAWKRLRALTDVVQEQQKEGEHLDRKVRFALIVMGLLNGAVVFRLRAGWPGAGMGALLGALALVDAYFFVQVIKALTPDGLATARDAGRPGLRSSAEISRLALDDYRRAWQEVDAEQLQAELASQAHRLGCSNTGKAAVIRRLFLSLYLMTALAAAGIGRVVLT
jgi:hypothetical protein